MKLLYLCFIFSIIKYFRRKISKLTVTASPAVDLPPLEFEVVEEAHVVYLVTGGGCWPRDRGCVAHSRLASIASSHPG